MTTKDAQRTEHEDSPKDECGSTSDEMARMIEKCGCGPMMAKMMAAHMGAGRPDDATKQEGAEPRCGERGDRNG